MMRSKSRKESYQDMRLKLRDDPNVHRFLAGRRFLAFINSYLHSTVEEVLNR